MFRSGSVNREPISRNESGRRGVESANEIQNGRTLSRNESMASMAGGQPAAHATVTVSRRANKAKPQTYTAMLTRWAAKVQKKGFREFERKRRNWPGLNFIMEYGIKQAAAALFLADIVSDIIVSAAFLGEANNAERCGVEPLWARTFAVFSVFFILMPLILTALFITGVQRRSFVYRKQLHELQLSMQDVAPGGPNFAAHHKAKQSFGADNMMSGNFTQQNISNTMRMAPFSEHTMAGLQAANNMTYAPPPPGGGNPYYAARFDGVQGYTHLADNPDNTFMPQPAAPRPQQQQQQQPDHTLLGRPPRGAGGVAEGLQDTSNAWGGMVSQRQPAASWSDYVYGNEEGFDFDTSDSSQAATALRLRSRGAQRLATAVAEAGHHGGHDGHPGANGHAQGPPQHPNPYVYTPGDIAMVQQPQQQPQGQPPQRRRRNRSVEEYVEHSSRLADEWEDPAFSYGGPQAPTPQAGTGRLMHELSDPANMQQQPLLGPNDLKKVSNVEKLERQSLICAILAFPLMLFAAVGLDVALVIVSLYPNVAFFIGFESVMPAYFAYRILVEVVLEALPQVLLQLIAFRTRPDTARKGRSDFCNGEQQFMGFSTDQIIMLSIVIAVLNLFKTIGTLYFEASSLEMGMMQYIRYLGEVGSTRLPLRSIAENTIGQKLTYEAVSQENELPPLFAAIRTNTSIKVMSVLKLKGKDIVRLVKTLERRFLPYALDISETAFNDTEHLALVMELLRSRHAQHVSFRGCTCTCSNWLRQEAFMYLRLHLPGGCTDDNQVPAANVESDTREVQEFADRLVDEWLHPCRVLKLSGRSKEWKQKGGFKGGSTPVDISMNTPQRASTLHAAFYFLSQNCTISSCECSYPIAPASLTSLLALLQSSHGIAKLKLSGARAVFDEEATMALASTLGASNGLRRLYLVRMFGDEAPMKPVLSSLAQCPYLSDLVLTGNKLGQVLCSMLGKLLLKFNDLRRLCIDACEIDDGAAAALATAIMSPKKPFSELRQLSFGGNNMSPAGLSSIARTFQHCSKLEELDLSCTPISSEPPIQHTPTGTSTTAMYDLLAALDHSAADDGPQGPGPAGRTITGGPGAMTRGSSMMNGSTMNGSTTTGINSSGQHRMLVWSSAMVRALSVILKLVPSVRCNGCVWHGSALEALSDCLRDNTNLQLVNIRMNEKQWDAKRDMPLSKMLGELTARQRDGMAGLKFIDFGGLPTGKMNHVMQRSTELMGRVQNLCVTCTSLRGDFKEGPDTLQVNDFSQLLPLVKATNGLKQLRLHAPSLTTAPVDFFRMAAGSLSSLTTLSLSAVNLGATESRPSLLDCISGPQSHPLANIADLSLRACFLGDDGARCLAVLLEKMPRLESLCVPDNRMTKTGFTALIDDWEKPGRSPSRLHTLDLSYNSIGIDGTRELAKVLHTLPSLHILRLAAVDMGSRGVAAISDAVLSAAEDNAHGRMASPGESGEMSPAAVPLIQLDLENNEIGDNGTEDLADALMVMPHLQVLKLAGNRPAFEGTQAIMNSVGTLSALQVLTLGDAIGTRYNRKQPVAGGGMTWEGIHLFATRLPQIAGLRELRMLGLGAPLISGFMDEVMFELCGAVRQLPSLQVIDLRGLGFVSPVAAAEIAHAVHNSPALSLVDLSGCHLGPGAVEVLRTQTASATCHVILQGTD